VAQIPGGEFRSSPMAVRGCGSPAGGDSFGAREEPGPSGRRFRRSVEKDRLVEAVFSLTAIGCGFPWQHGGRFPGVVTDEVAPADAVFVPREGCLTRKPAGISRSGLGVPFAVRHHWAVLGQTLMTPSGRRVRFGRGA